VTSWESNELVHSLSDPPVRRTLLCLTFLMILAMAQGVAHAVVERASDPQERAGKAFLVSGAGVKLVS